LKIIIFIELGEPLYCSQYHAEVSCNNRDVFSSQASKPFLYDALDRFLPSILF